MGLEQVEGILSVVSLCAVSYPLLRLLSPSPISLIFLPIPVSSLPDISPPGLSCISPASSVILSHVPNLCHPLLLLHFPSCSVILFGVTIPASLFSLGGSSVLPFTPPQSLMSIKPHRSCFLVAVSKAAGVACVSLKVTDESGDVLV